VAVYGIAYVTVAVAGVSGGCSDGGGCDDFGCSDVGCSDGDYCRFFTVVIVVVEE
jgi:hypothetical protein